MAKLSVNINKIATIRNARGAGGDISRNIDIIAEKTVLDYLKEINFQCVVLGEEWLLSC